MTYSGPLKQAWYVELSNRNNTLHAMNRGMPSSDLGDIVNGITND